MRIYHGSDVTVKTPKILTANRLLDFCKYADVKQI